MMCAVKRFLCLVLMLWFALQGGLAQAHLVTEDMHSLEHAALALQAKAKATMDHGSDSCCSLAHCCHLASVLDVERRVPAVIDTSKAPARADSPIGHMVPHEIERPKWAHATPAVVNA